jgi:protein SCO1
MTLRLRHSRFRGNDVNVDKIFAALTSCVTYLFITVLIYFVNPAGAAIDNPDDILKKIGFDQKLNETIPLDAVFKNESGQPVKLGELVHDKPVILTLVYFECPMLCTVSLNGLVRALRTLKFDVGKEFDVLTVSFEPKETPLLAQAKKDNYLHEYARPGSEKGWHFLTGDQANIHRLTESVGFRYVFDKTSKQYAHPAGILVLTPQGKISKYFYDVEYSPKDIRLALIEAAEGKIGSPIDQILLYCYHYDPVTGKYGLLIMRVIRLAASLTLFILLAFIFTMLRWERKNRHG